MVLEIKKQHDTMKRKVDETEFIVHKTQKKTSNQDDLAKQILNLVSGNID